jgi:nucleoid-associated protein YgaU
MLRTDLEMPRLIGSAVAAGSTSRFVRLTCSGILVISCTIFGFSQCYAQQDVAEAARQEKARKENQQKKAKHVYTDEDLKRAQILIPEDRAEVEARKGRQPLPAANESQESVDVLALPAELPLGDVARNYRRMRESLRLQQSAEFHLPFADEPVHATPKPSVVVAIKPPVLVSPNPPVTPLRPVISIPSPPRVEPFQPPVKRSPFERPRVFSPAAPRVAPSQPLTNHEAPPKPPAVSATRVGPSTISVAPAKPAAPPPIVRFMPPTRIAPRMTPAPAAPVVHTAPSRTSTLSVAPSKPAAPRADFSVMPSPAHDVHVTPAQPVAPAVRPTPSKPSTLSVAPSQPAAPVIRVAPSQPTSPARTAPAGPAKLNVLTVQPGDSLWKLAQQNLGAGLRWHDLVAANPAIVDPNHIVAGSHIFLPLIGSRFRTATRILVQKGDTLSGIAQNRFGHASFWACIAHANPAIHDANLIYEGQVLLLPANCKP